MTKQQTVALGAALVAGLLMLCGNAGAEIYRSVDAAGNVTFSDRPAEARTTPATPAPDTADDAAAGPALPWELQQASKRYPVTLYTQSDCVPCSSGRNLLTNRGIPFTERTIQTNDDVQAFRKLSPSAELPLLAIGGQHLSGYSDQTWSQYLDAAGYPATSQLPANWKQPPASPLVPSTLARNSPAGQPGAPAEETGNAASRTDVDSLLNPRPSATNPAGLRF